MPHTAPDLRFGPGTSYGFTPSGIAAFDNLRPAAVVREFIQNALDAAQTAGVERANVRFRLTRIPRASLPGIESYGRAFEKALETQRDMTGGELSHQAKLVARRIRDALDEEELEVLSVLDNGVGLDEQRMNALLSDGLSIKEGDATGTYGNGHSTAIPASDLRYVLYGGVTSSGKKIGAGHAVLASHVEEGERHPRAGDGFFIRNFNAGKGKLYDYATDDEIPELIAGDLASIRETQGHGTVVVVPAFNNFLEDDSLWDMVSHAAAANFFVAIEERRLKVTVEDDRPGQEPTTQILDEITLTSELEKHKDQRRAVAFLNGRRAFEAHQAYRTGEEHCIPTSVGKIDIRLLRLSSGNTRIDLCRNGMWITEGRSIPGFSQQFADHMPFHAVLSLNARDGRQLHDLVRIAEGPLHDSITIKRLPEADRWTCRTALREIVAWILEHVPQIESDSYRPPDYLSLDFSDLGDEGGDGTGKARKVFWGAPIAIRRNPARQLHLLSIDPDTEQEEGERERTGRKRKVPNPPSPDRSRRRPALPTIFQAASRPAGPSRRRIIVQCPNGCADAQLRLVVDEALDATCERPGQDAYTPAVLSNILVNGKEARKRDLIVWDDDVIGVRLGDLPPDSSVDIETDYRLMGDFQGLSNPSLRVEVFRSGQDQSKAAKSKGQR